VFELRRDTEVRRQSFQDPPDWHRHLDWYRTVIDDPGRRLLIIETSAGPAGQIRLDTVGDDEVVALAIAEPARGRGLAQRALAIAKELAAGDLVAHIKPDNTRSLAAFAAAGFVTESASPDEIVVRWSNDHRLHRAAAS
jgi:RimJ/RimL family protein N-acetyltransferase